MIRMTPYVSGCRATVVLALALFAFTMGPTRIAAQNSSTEDGAANGSEEKRESATCGTTYTVPAAAIHIDMSKPGGAKTVWPKKVREPAPVVVTNANPFLGRHRLIVDTAQALPDSDPVGTLLEFIKFAYGDLPQIPGIREILEADTSAILEMHEGGREVDPNKCPLSAQVRKLSNRLETVRNDLHSGLKSLSDLASDHRVTMTTTWSTLRTPAEAGKICTAMGQLVTEAETYLKASGDSLRAIEVRRTELSQIATELTSLLDAGKDEPACLGLSPERVRAATAAAIATQADIWIEDHQAQDAKLDSMVTRLKDMARDPYTFTMVETIPLVSRPAVVDVRVQRAPTGSTGEDDFRTVEVTRVRFDRKQPFEAGLGVGMFYSSIPTANFEAEEVLVPGPVGEPDTTIFRVAVDGKADHRLVPAAVIAIGRTDTKLGGLGAHGYLGVGVNAVGEKTPNYLGGFGFGSHPFYLSIGFTAAEVKILDDDLQAGSVLEDSTDPPVSSDLAWGLSFGVTLLVR